MLVMRRKIQFSKREEKSIYSILKNLESLLYHISDVINVSVRRKKKKILYPRENEKFTVCKHQNSKKEKNFVILEKF